MKKINLRGVSEILNDNEMKDVRGGEWGEPPVIDFDAEPGSEDSGGGGGTCAAYIPKYFSTGALTGTFDLGSSSSAQFLKDKNASIYRGISKEKALAMTAGVSGAKWCCDSCGSASWYYL